MPRRRMLDPDFWSDSRVKRLAPTERLLFVGMISHADDDGRLLADPAFLRSKIFPYDDFTLEQITSMRDHIIEINPNLQLYQNAGEDYLYFRKWPRYQKPSHPQPSKLPKAPELQEEVPEQSNEPLPESLLEQDQPQTRIKQEPFAGSLGQSSLGKVSIGKDRAVQEDFSEFFDSDKDLTDFLTKTLEKYLPRGPTWAVEVLQELWSQVLGARMGANLLAITLQAVKIYPAPVLAMAYAKAVKYRGGKYDSAKYVAKILEEQMKKQKPP